MGDEIIDSKSDFENQGADAAGDADEVVFQSQRREEAQDAMLVLREGSITATMTSDLGFGTVLATTTLAHVKVWTYSVWVDPGDAERASALLDSEGLVSEMPEAQLKTAERPWVAGFRRGVGRLTVVLLFLWFLVVLKTCTTMI